MHSRMPNNNHADQDVAQDAGYEYATKYYADLENMF